MLVQFVKKELIGEKKWSLMFLCVDPINVQNALLFDIKTHFAFYYTSNIQQQFLYIPCTTLPVRH